MGYRCRNSIITLVLIGFLNPSGIGYSQSSTADTTCVVLLGSGTPNAEPDRSGTAVAVVVSGTPYIIDFGPGVVRRASAAYQEGIEGLEEATAGDGGTAVGEGSTVAVGAGDGSSPASPQAVSSREAIIKMAIGRA